MNIPSNEQFGPNDPNSLAPDEIAIPSGTIVNLKK